MRQLQLVTDWQFIDGRNVARCVTDYAGTWWDATGQPDANIQPSPNTVIFQGIVTDAVFADIQADEALALPESPVILWDEEYIEDAT